MAQAADVSNAIAASITDAGLLPFTNLVQAAHAEFVTILAGHPPGSIPLFPRAADLEDRADHLETVLDALSVYLTTMLVDTAQNVPGGLNRRSVEALLSDLTCEAVGIVRIAADEAAGRIE